MRCCCCCCCCCCLRCFLMQLLLLKLLLLPKVRGPAVDRYSRTVPWHPDAPCAPSFFGFLRLLLVLVPVDSFALVLVLVPAVLSFFSAPFPCPRLRRLLFCILRRLLFCIFRRLLFSSLGVFAPDLPEPLEPV